MMSGAPRNCTPYSIDASRSGVTTLPATRTTKRSPGLWSNTRSGTTRESAQLRIAAIGYCACARAARPDEKSRSFGRIRGIARIACPSAASARSAGGSRWAAARRRAWRIGGEHAVPLTAASAATAPASAGTAGARTRDRVASPQTAYVRTSLGRISACASFIPITRRERHLRALLDRAPRVELERHVGAADRAGAECPRPPDPATSSRRGSWPAQITIVSTSSTCGSPSTLMCSPASSMRSYSTPPIIATPRCFSSVRRIQPVVLARPAPTFVVLALQQPQLARRRRARAPASGRHACA